MTHELPDWEGRPMITVDSIWKWLKDGGFDQPRSGVMVDVTRHPGDCFLLTVKTLVSKCERCSTRGPSALVRLMGSCAACASGWGSERRTLRILVNTLIPLLREDFEFQSDEELRGLHGYVRNRVQDNSAIVRIYLKEKINQ